MALLLYPLLYLPPPRVLPWRLGKTYSKRFQRWFAACARSATRRKHLRFVPCAPTLIFISRSPMTTTGRPAEAPLERDNELLALCKTGCAFLQKGASRPGISG